MKGVGRRSAVKPPRPDRPPDLPETFNYEGCRPSVGGEASPVSETVVVTS